MADVLLVYHADRREGFDDEIQQRRFDSSVDRLNDFFGSYKLDELNQALTTNFVKKRGRTGGARRDLENLRAAINYHAAQNLHHAVIKVMLPPKGKAREQWLDRSQAARLLWAATPSPRRDTKVNRAAPVRCTCATVKPVDSFVMAAPDCRPCEAPVRTYFNPLLDDGARR
jgi:hypothetical protein